MHQLEKDKIKILARKHKAPEWKKEDPICQDHVVPVTPRRTSQLNSFLHSNVFREQKPERLHRKHIPEKVAVEKEFRPRVHENEQKYKRNPITEGEGELERPITRGVRRLKTEFQPSTETKAINDKKFILPSQIRPRKVQTQSVQAESVRDLIYSSTYDS